MARLNIEDSIDADPRFKRLRRLLDNDEDRAMGMLIRFWKLAQLYWGKDSLVPKEQFLDEGLGAVLESGLAEDRPDGIYARGSEERFSWYQQRVSASRKGGAARAKTAARTPAGRWTQSGDSSSVRLDKLQRPAGVKSRPAGEPSVQVNTSVRLDKLQPEASRTLDSDQPSYSLNTKERRIVSKTFNTCAKPASFKPKDSAPCGAVGSTLLDATSQGVEVEVVKNTEPGPPAYAVEASPSGSATNSAELTLPVKKGKGDGWKVQAFIGKYVDAFRLRYGTRPVLDGAARGAAQSIARALSVQRGFDAAEIYLQMDDPKYVRKCHDLTSMRMDLNRIIVALDQGVEDPGKDVSRRKAERELDRRLDEAEAKEAERQRELQEQLQQVEREERERYGQG